MQLEAVCAISVRDLLLETLGQVDDFDGLVGALFDAHTAADAEVLRDEADGRSGLNVDANLALLVQGASLSTLLSALARLALIGIDDCDSELCVRHVFVFLASRAKKLSRNYE